MGAALFALYLLRARDGAAPGSEEAAGPVAVLAGFTAIMLWLTSIVGTYIVFPPYRATPPEGATDLTRYPRSLLLANPETAWLHGFAMETKEHLPWIATMLATATAYVAWRYRARLFRDPHLRTLGTILLIIAFVAVAYVSLLGILVNKVAPLQ